MATHAVIGLSPILGIPDPDGADCVDCGRCCHHGAQTVHLLEDDEQRLGDELLAHYTELQAKPPGFRFIKNEGQVCGALDTSAKGKYPCAIYERRPEDCRIVDAGSPVCLEARALGRLGTSVDYKRVRLPLL
jgi:Fe-S-cluster containining protein